MPQIIEVDKTARITFVVLKFRNKVNREAFMEANPEVKACCM